MELETDLEEWARREISLHGGWMQKITFPGRRGAPDNLIFWPTGRVDLAEFKRPNGTGRVSHNQTEIHKKASEFHRPVWLLATRAQVWHYIMTVAPRKAPRRA